MQSRSDNATIRLDPGAMLTDVEFWLETGATATVLLLIPVYMGFIHVGAFGAGAYVLVAGVAMALGEQLQFHRSPRVSPSDVLLWAAATGGIGGAGYLLALIFI